LYVKFIARRSGVPSGKPATIATRPTSARTSRNAAARERRTRANELSTIAGTSRPATTTGQANRNTAPSPNSGRSRPP
jgi:hypothetical protein